MARSGPSRSSGKLSPSSSTEAGSAVLPIGRLVLAWAATPRDALGHGVAPKNGLSLQGLSRVAAVFLL